MSNDLSIELINWHKAIINYILNKEFNDEIWLIISKINVICLVYICRVILYFFNINFIYVLS